MSPTLSISHIWTLTSLLAALHREIIEPSGDEGLLWNCHTYSWLSQLPLLVACCHVSPATVHTRFENISPDKLPILRHFWSQTTDSDGLVVWLPCSNQSPCQVPAASAANSAFLALIYLALQFFFLIVTTSEFLHLWAKCPHDFYYGSSLKK